MTLREMIDTLHTQHNWVELRDIINFEIGQFPIGSEALDPFLDREVREWFPGAAPFHNVNFTVMIDED